MQESLVKLWFGWLSHFLLGFSHSLKVIFKCLLLKLTAENTFTLNSKFYKQIDGCLVGGPFPVIFSNIYISVKQFEFPNGWNL